MIVLSGSPIVDIRLHHRHPLQTVVLRGFPRVDAAGLRLVRRGRLCEDVCFGHDSRGEVPRGALDSKDGSVHYSCGMVMVGGKGVVVNIVLIYKKS